MLKYLLSAALLFSIPAVAEIQEAKTVVGKIYGDITISEAGIVSAVTFKNVKDPKIAALLESQVRKWEFHPMLVNGSPQLAEAGFSMDIFVTQDVATKKTTQIVLDDVRVMPTALELAAKESTDTTTRVHPRYPVNAIYMDLGARLNVALQINANGFVEKAAVKNFAFLNAQNGAISTKLTMAQKEFSQNATNAAKQWRFSEAALRRNECVGGCISLIQFEFTTADKPWNVYREVKTPDIDWYPTNQPNNDISEPKSQLVRFKEQPSNQSIDLGS
jgi:hypothetical protein